jgi:hypothetical protein
VRAASISASAFALAPQRFGLSTFKCEICTRHCVISPMRMVSSTAFSSSVPSFRRCDAYTPPMLAVTLASSRISEVLA